jgi:hypothetical protein
MNSTRFFSTVTDDPVHVMVGLNSFLLLTCLSSVSRCSSGRKDHLIEEQSGRRKRAGYGVVWFTRAGKNRISGISDRATVARGTLEDLTDRYVIALKEGTEKDKSGIAAARLLAQVGTGKYTRIDTAIAVSTAGTKRH